MHWWSSDTPSKLMLDLRLLSKWWEVSIPNACAVIIQIFILNILRKALSFFFVAFPYIFTLHLELQIYNQWLKLALSEMMQDQLPKCSDLFLAWFPPPHKTNSEAYPTPYSVGTVGLFPRTKVAGEWSWLLTPSSGEVKLPWCYIIM